MTRQTGLRFDKVATRVVERLRAAAADVVPDGMTVVATITAPIRLPAKTVAAVEDKIRTTLARRARGDVKATINGNRVQIRIVEDASKRAPKLIGYVHNPGVNPLR